MSKAEKMLKNLGFRPFKTAFDDWHSYVNKDTGAYITFMDDLKIISSPYELVLNIDLLQALLAKTKELGWTDEGNQ